jgi:hypothetical protein
VCGNETIAMATTTAEGLDIPTDYLILFIEGGSNPFVLKHSENYGEWFEVGKWPACFIKEYNICSDADCSNKLVALNEVQYTLKG